MAKYSMEPVNVPPVSTKYRQIRTALPVPESLPIFESLAGSEPRSMMGMPPVVWDRAEGFTVHDCWGNRWLDWSSGVLVTNAGHGHPEFWHTLGNDAVQGDMNLGDGPSGLLRYFWQCSCETFAHGPQSCPSSSFVYACPEDFDGSSDSASMRNVYERWGPVLGDDLRLACGVSTDAWCHEYNVVILMSI